MRAVGAPDKVVVTLPGYHMLDGMAWLVPGSKKPVEDLLGVWEDFVDTAMEGRGPPDRIPWRACPGRRDAALGYLGGPRGPDQWWVPAVQLLAIVAKRAGTEVYRRAGGVWASVGDYQVGVAPDGCYSNKARGIRKAVFPATDGDSEELLVQPLETAHPIANLVVGHWATPESARALNSLLRDGYVFKVSDFAPPRRGNPRPVGRRPKDIADVVNALNALRCDLEMGAPIGELYRVAVPYAMTARQFRAVVGHEVRYPAGRLREKTRQKVLDWLDRREVELTQRP